MGLTEAGHIVIGFIKAHEQAGPFILAALAFGESIAFVSLLIPATFILMGLGGVMGVGGLAFWPFCIGASLGAIAGDIVSYEAGRHYGLRIRKFKIVQKHRRLLAYGRHYFRKWGFLSLAIGRFVGPARAVVPLCAGLNHMNRLAFLAITTASASVWSFILLAPGAIGLSAIL